MSELVRDKVYNFVIHLTPGKNPYQATADYLATFLMPCPLPSWSLYIRRVIAVAFFIMWIQSIYVLYIRSKSKNIYHIGLNGMGLVQLDRANHCGLCYLLYSTLAFVELICEEFELSAHLDQRWPNFILCIKFAIIYVCAGVILWLCVCHFALVKQRTTSSSRRMVPMGKLLPTGVIWALNILSMIIIFAPTVPIIISFSQLSFEYYNIRLLVTPVIRSLHESASKCSIVTCQPLELFPRLIPLKRTLVHIDLLIQRNKEGLNYYLFMSGIIILSYIPFLYFLVQSFKNRNRLDPSTKRQVEGVFANTLLEFTMVLVGLILVCYAKYLVEKGNHLFNPKFYLTISIGFNSVISVLGNIALLLILCSVRRTNVTHPDPPVPITQFACVLEDAKLDETKSSQHS